MAYKALLAGVAMVITFAAFLPYIIAIHKGRVSPHVFSWVIWSMSTLVVFVAQLQDRGGWGAWAIGVSAVITIFIALLAYGKRGDIHITRADWLFFVAALTSLPFWYLSGNPLWAVLIMTTVDVLGFGPTLRKAYERPHSESVLFFGLFALRNVLVVGALEHYSLTTVLFPAVIALACLAVIAVLALRRRSLLLEG